MDNSVRHVIPSQDPKVRVNNFNEVALGFDVDTATAEAKRCLQCKNPQCVKGCPVNVNIPGFVGKIASGDIDGAAAILEKDNNLAAICVRRPQVSQTMVRKCSHAEVRFCAYIHFAD